MKKNYRGKMRFVAMIPARMGSTRLAMKNLALLHGKPLIYYAVLAAKGSGIFNEIFINSENSIFGKIAARYRVSFYKRPESLGSSEAKSDDVVYNFIKNNMCDVLVWVNPTSPLQTGDDIRNAVKYFVKNELDTLITVKNEQVHCVYKDKPINFRASDLFAQTQDLTPVNPFVYSVMMWRSKPFVRAFEKNGRAFFIGKVGYCRASKMAGIIIKREEDLMLADYMLKVVKNKKNYRLRYDRIVSAEKG